MSPESWHWMRNLSGLGFWFLLAGFALGIAGMNVESRSKLFPSLALLISGLPIVYGAASIMYFYFTRS